MTDRGALEFEPRPGSLLYASFETGYRSGGFSFSTLSPTYKPERIDAFTIGSKNRFLDNRLQVNIEGFVWKYKDQQIAHQVQGPNGNLEFVTENVGSSTNKGVEAEIVAKPLRNTTLRADLQYLDAKNDKFVYSEFDSSGLAGLPAGSIPSATLCRSVSLPATSSYTIDCSGLRALRSPKWTINLGAQQIVPLAANLELALEANTHYQSSNIVMFERRAFSVMPAYWMIDVSVGVRAEDSGWSLTAFASNLENTRVMGASFYLGGLTTGNFGPPRTYGARLQFKI